ncbi:MAG: hypothetical protein PHR39_07765, partial [Actinomycetota bacterium]|nr:hypothetical protein [Actinomycetota bacterium]
KSQQEQYSKNIDNSLSWVKATENNLMEISNVMVSLREICIEAGNGALNQDSLNSLLPQVAQLKEKLLGDANSTYLGNYIFAGLNTTQKPFEEISGNIVYNGDDNSMVREISFESSIVINMDGKKIFNMDNTVSGSPDVFQIVKNLEQAITNGDVNLINGEILSQVDEARANVLNLVSETGSIVKRLELTKQQHENDIINMTENISINEDIDIIEVIMKLKEAETVYLVSLNAAGRIFQPSLLDYLK